MKHRVKGYQLNRDVKHRRSLFKNLISDLIVHGQIKTTQAKASAVKPTVDKLITQAKAGQLHHRRLIDAYLNNSSLVTKLVKDIAPQFSKRSGGYTKITRIGRRRGDNTMMVRLELLKPATVTEATTPKPETNKPAAPKKSKTTPKAKLASATATKKTPKKGK
jgi:large subunit ribosomal protein L17